MNLAINPEKKRKFEKVVIVLGFINLAWEILEFILMQLLLLNSDFYDSLDSHVIPQFVINIELADVLGIAVLLVWQIAIMKKNISEKVLYGTVWGYLALDTISDMIFDPNYLRSNLLSFVIRVTVIAVFVYGMLYSERISRLRVILGSVGLAYTIKFLVSMISNFVRLATAEYHVGSTVHDALLAYGFTILYFAVMMMFAVWLVFMNGPRDLPDDDCDNENNYVNDYENTGVNDNVITGVESEGIE